MNIHCPRCARDFTDPRTEMLDGDEAICPHCGARHVFRCAAGAAEGPDAPRPLHHVNGNSPRQDESP